MFGFEGIFTFKAQWLSWLERRPVTAKVVGSSPIWVVWGLSSAGRASALQAEGHRFEPYRPHFNAREWLVKFRFDWFFLCVRGLL